MKLIALTSKKTAAELKNLRALTAEECRAVSGGGRRQQFLSSKKTSKSGFDRRWWDFDIVTN